MMTLSYDQRSGNYPRGQQYPYATQPNYAYDQRNFGSYPYQVQSNTSPYFQMAAPNYGNGYGYSTNNNPPYIDSNYGFDQRNYANPPSYPQQHQQSQTPTHGYGYSTPSQSNNFYDSNNFGYPPQTYNSPPQQKSIYFPSESHIESSHTYDQRNYGHSVDSRHEVNLATKPHITEQ